MILVCKFLTKTKHGIYCSLISYTSCGNALNNTTGTNNIFPHKSYFIPINIKANITPNIYVNATKTSIEVEYFIMYSIFSFPTVNEEDIKFIHIDTKCHMLKMSLLRWVYV